MGAGGGVCIIGWEAEHGRKRSEGEGERIEVPAARAVCSSGTYDFVDCMPADYFRFSFLFEIRIDFENDEFLRVETRAC